MTEDNVGFHCRHRHLTGIVCMLNKGHEGNHKHTISWQNDEVKKID